MVRSDCHGDALDFDELKYTPTTTNIPRLYREGYEIVDVKNRCEFEGSVGEVQLRYYKPVTRGGQYKET